MDWTYIIWVTSAKVNVKHAKAARENSLIPSNLWVSHILVLLNSMAINFHLIYDKSEQFLPKHFTIYSSVCKRNYR